MYSNRKLASVCNVDTISPVSGTLQSYKFNVRVFFMTVSLQLENRLMPGATKNYFIFMDTDNKLEHKHE